jgi:hypothetical protein
MMNVPQTVTVTTTSTDSDIMISGALTGRYFQLVPRAAVTVAVVT